MRTKMAKALGTDMKKARSIKVSGLEALRSPPSRILQTTAPNYMKPTSSSNAKKELFQVILQNTQSGSNGRKASFVSSKKPEKTLTSSSSLNLMTTLPKTNSEGDSVMMVCSYKYCSLNDHLRQPSLPPSKSSLLERRHLLKTQKTLKHEARSPYILKGPCETKKYKNIEQENVFDGRPAYDEANMVTPTITPLAQEIDMHFFIGVNCKENEEDIEDPKQMSFVSEENGLAVEEVGVEQVTRSMTRAVLTAEIDIEEDLKNCCSDVTIEADTNKTFYLEQNAEDADEKQQPIWFHEEVSIGSYRSKVSYDEENEENIELDVSDSHYMDFEWEEEHYCASSHREDNDSSVSSEDILVANEDENSCSETKPQGINYFLEGTSEIIKTHGIDYSSNRLRCYQSSSTEEVFQHLINAEDDNIESEKHVGDEASYDTNILHHEMAENSEGHKMIEACEINENLEDLQLLEGSSFIGDENENASNNWQWRTRRLRRVQDDEEMRKIKPRKPNLLPLARDEEPEKVKLKHKVMDERKNVDEWMLDFALRETITKLAPAGNKKVALLVEAFETVMSIPKRETRMNNNSPFAHARPIQACI